MRDAFVARRIIDTDGNRAQLHTMPNRKDQQFELSLIARSDETQAVQMMKGIGSIATLCVGKVMPRLKSEPEIGKTSGENRSLRFVFVLERSGPNDDGRLRNAVQGIKEDGEILGIMLPVTVDRYRIIVAQTQRFTKAADKSLTLAAVAVMSDDMQGMWIVLNHFGSIVGRSIVHHKDIGREKSQAVENRRQRRHVIVSGNEDDWSQLEKKIKDLRFFTLLPK